MALLQGHREALSADFRRFYGCSLTDALEGRVAPGWEVEAWAANLPPESATAKEISPALAAGYSLEVELLRAVEFGIRGLQWMQGDGKSKKPKPIEFDWDTNDSTTGADALDWETAAESMEAAGADPRTVAMLERMRAHG